MTSFISVKLAIHRIARDLLYDVAIVYRNLYSALFKCSIPYQDSFSPLANPLCGPRMVARLILSETVVRRVGCAALRATHDVGRAVERWSMADQPCISCLHVHPRRLASIFFFLVHPPAPPWCILLLLLCQTAIHMARLIVKGQDARLIEKSTNLTSSSTSPIPFSFDLMPDVRQRCGQTDR